MISATKLLLATGATIAAFALLGAKPLLTSEPAKVGEVTPSWVATDYTGKTWSVSDEKGKYVVLEWTNKDCPFVKKHYESGSMQATQEKAKEMGAEWFTVISSAPGHQGYLDADGVKAYRLDKKVHSKTTLVDPDGKLGHMYGARTTPQIVIIDPKGTIIYNGAIDDKATPDQEDLKGATNYALQALSEAKAGKAVSVPTSRPYGCSVKYAG